VLVISSYANQQISLQASGKSLPLAQRKLSLTFSPNSSTIFNVMNKEHLAEIILNILEKQSFEHWYSNEFQDYITGEENAPTKAEILKELEWQAARELQREKQTRSI
jgi:hypothetical protein